MDCGSYTLTNITEMLTGFTYGSARAYMRRRSLNTTRKDWCGYRDRLFEFLNHDGVPWNNNNAENAIKPFAKYRAMAGDLSTRKGLEDYLVLLSIQQTCKYRGISFLEFLKSGKSTFEL